MTARSNVLVESSWTRDLFLVWMGSFLISLCAPLSLKLPFTPISLTLAPHICLFLGAILGKSRGSLAVLAYLFQGIIGLPVFALGNGGLLYLLGPSGGYLLGYAAAAYVTGYLIEKSGRVALGLVTGNAVIYFLGVLHLSLFIGLKSAIVLGMVPFLAGDMLKLILVYKGLKRLKK